MNAKELTVYKMEIIHKRLLSLEQRQAKAIANGASASTLQNFEIAIERLTEKFNDLMLLSEKQVQTDGF